MKFMCDFYFFVNILYSYLQSFLYFTGYDTISCCVSSSIDMYSEVSFPLSRRWRLARMYTV